MTDRRPSLQRELDEAFQTEVDRERHTNGWVRGLGTFRKFGGPLLLIGAVLLFVFPRIAPPEARWYALIPGALFLGFGLLGFLRGLLSK